MRTPILGQSYVVRSINAADDVLINLYPEATPEGKTAGYLQRCPGSKLIASLGDGPIRGMWSFGGFAYVVSGTSLYRLNENLDPKYLGEVAGYGPVSMADNGYQLFIACNPKGFIYNATTGVLVEITDEDFAGAVQVTYMYGLFIFNQPNSQTFWITGYDGTEINPLEFASAEISPDTIQAIIANHTELWIFGTNSIEVWYYNADVNFPFAPIQGAYNEIGCAAGFSVAKLDNTLYWLGQDARGFGIVYRARGYNAERVSTHAIEYAIQSYSYIGDAIAYTYQQDGHAFYVLTFPTASATWVYDVSTNMWHQRASFLDGAFYRHRSNCMVNYAGYIMVGDYQDGSIYSLDLDYFSDNGQSQKWVRSWRALPTGQNNLKRTAQHALQIDFETGAGTTGIPPAGKYWRIRILSNWGGLTYSLIGVQMYTSFNGSNVAATATPFASSGTASGLFDGTQEWIGTATPGQYVGVEFANRLTIQYVAIQYIGTSAPQNIVIEYSNDGSTYYELNTVQLPYVSAPSATLEAAGSTTLLTTHSASLPANNGNTARVVQGTTTYPNYTVRNVDGTFQYYAVDSASDNLQFSYAGAYARTRTGYFDPSGNQYKVIQASCTSDTWNGLVEFTRKLINLDGTVVETTTSTVDFSSLVTPAGNRYSFAVIGSANQSGDYFTMGNYDYPNRYLYFVKYDVAANLSSGVYAKIFQTNIGGTYYGFVNNSGYTVLHLTPTSETNIGRLYGIMSSTGTTPYAIGATNIGNKSISNPVTSLGKSISNHILLATIYADTSTDKFFGIRYDEGLDCLWGCFGTSSGYVTFVKFTSSLAISSYKTTPVQYINEVYFSFTGIHNGIAITNYGSGAQVNATDLNTSTSQIQRIMIWGQTSFTNMGREIIVNEKNEKLSVKGTDGKVKNGKYYIEFNASNQYVMLGLVSDVSPYDPNTINVNPSDCDPAQLAEGGYIRFYDGTLYGAFKNVGSTYTGTYYGGWCGMAVNLDRGRIWLRDTSGVWNGNPETGIGGIVIGSIKSLAQYLKLRPAAGMYAGAGSPATATMDFNFGEAAFQYTIPTGYRAGLFYGDEGDQTIPINVDIFQPNDIDPAVLLRWSDDGGHTWSYYHERNLGKLGETSHRVIWRRLGMTTKLRDRVYEVSGKDATKIAIMGAELDVTGTSA